MPAQGHRNLNFIEQFGLSGVAAVTSKTFAAPIERVKLLVQNQDEMVKQGVLDKPYSGVGDCLKRTLKNEGVVSLWRGNLANCLRYFPTQALNFAFKGSIKKAVGLKKTDTPLVKLGKNVVSGGVAGGMSLCFVYPLDYARTRMAADLKGKDGGERKFNGMIDCFKKTFASDGIGGLYRGFAISLVGIVIYRGAYFGLYDTLKPLLLGEDAGVAVSFLLGYAVTVAAGIISYPLDTVRRRLMMTSGSAVKYNGSLDCVQQIMKNEGVMSFFKGAGANVLRGMAGAGVLSGFDKVSEMYIDFREAA